jgi:large subunit ribosomal protein L24
MQPPDQEPQPTTSMEQPLPILSVRLVHPIKDPTTGQKKDMIITKLIRSQHAHFDRVTNTASWHRVIPGLNIRIPWPKKHRSEFKEHPIDTLRMEVEARTYIPTLLTPPMPSTVIDELRNKFSIFRTRHEPEYIEKKMQEDREVVAKKQLAKRMRTPLHEINRKERKLRRLRGKGTLTSGMMERIGRAIEERRRLMGDSVGTTGGMQEVMPQVS